jgi:hypothetical protein
MPIVCTEYKKIALFSNHSFLVIEMYYADSIFNSIDFLKVILHFQ